MAASILIITGQRDKAALALTGSRNTARKGFKQAGKIPDPAVALERGISLEVCANLHGKFLLWDDDNIAITSFNWMATVTDGTRSRGAEIGMWISGPNLGPILAEKLSSASGGTISL